MDDRFGHLVSLSGKYLVVGSPHNSQYGYQTGSIYIFERETESSVYFAQQEHIYSPIPTFHGDFGWSVDVNSKGVIAVGAKGDHDMIG
jgi:hypothetical protein